MANTATAMSVFIETGRDEVVSVADQQDGRLSGAPPVDRGDEHASGGPWPALLDASLLLRIIEDAPVAIAVVQGPEHRLIYANTLYRSLPNVENTSIIGRTVREVFPRVSARSLRLLEQVYATASPVSQRGYRTQGLPGRPNSVWNIDLLPIMSSGNEVSGIVMMLHDITDVANARSNGDRHARDAEDARWILNGLMQYIPEGIAIAEAPPAGAIRMVSTYASALSGRPTDTLIGIPLRDYVAKWGVLRADGTAPQADELPLVRALRSGKVVTDEQWLLERPDGERVPILCNAGPIRNDTGAIAGGVIAWRDMRALKHEMDARRQAEDSLQVALGAAGMASWDLDIANGRSWRSVGHDRMFGYTEGRANWCVGDFLEHVVAEDREATAQHFERAAEEGGLHFECRIRRADNGEIRWIEVTGRICRDDDNREPQRLAAILRDITAAKAAEAALRRAQDEAHRADTAARDAMSARFGTLTSRQRDVMALVVAGHLNKEIAFRLGISERTVEGHRARVMERMRADNLADLVRIADALGIGAGTPAEPPESRS